MKILTVNLEEKLINSKRKTIDKLVKENEVEQKLLDQVQNILTNDMNTDISKLKDSGFHRAISNAENIQDRVTKRENTNSKIKNERIFTLSEIKDIAIKYGLRFLPTIYYKGSIPNELPQKIKEFESLGLPLKNLAESRISESNIWDISWRDLWDFYDKGQKISYAILAPSESFHLQPKPKDPLLFAILEDGTFYLVHKWGKDLTVWNYIKNIKNRSKASWTLNIFLKTMIITIFIPTLLSGGNLAWGLGITAVALILLMLAYVMDDASFGSDRLFTGRNSETWNSPYGKEN